MKGKVLASTLNVRARPDRQGKKVGSLANEAWLLLQIGLGGYVAGRSLEKISSQVQQKDRAGTTQRGKVKLAGS